MRYPDFIDPDRVYSDNKPIKGTIYKERNILRAQFKGDFSVNQNICFIMKNPSLADEQIIDKTVSNVLHYTHQLKQLDQRFKAISEVVIVNLFAIYATDSSTLLDIIEQNGEDFVIGNENDTSIRMAVSDASFIVPAWGQKPDNFHDDNINLYRNRIYSVFNEIIDSNKNEIIYLIGEKKQKKLYPRHPERIGYSDQKVLNKFALNPYIIKGKYLVKV